MKAAVWHGVKDVRVEEWELKELKANEVKVKVAWAGLCGSDLHEYLDPSTIPVDKPDPVTGDQAPLAMGHEFAGVIEEVGSDVEGLEVGTRVAVNPMLTFGNKPFPEDAYDGFNFIGIGTDGGFAEYAIAPAENVYPLPENMTLQEGALVEPTAVGMQAVLDAKFEIGQDAAVIGTGPIGLTTIASLKAAGANRIVAFDVSEARLKLAKQMGATHVVKTDDVDDPVEALLEILPEKADATFEAAGIEATFNQAIESTKPLGHVEVISLITKPIEFVPMQLIATGVKLSGTLAYTPDTYQKTLDLIASGIIDVKAMVTDKIELDHIVEEGFEALLEDKSQSKILVKLSGEN